MGWLAWNIFGMKHDWRSRCPTMKSEQLSVRQAWAWKQLLRAWPVRNGPSLISWLPGVVPLGPGFQRLKWEGRLCLKELKMNEKLMSKAWFARGNSKPDWEMNLETEEKQLIYWIFFSYLATFFEKRNRTQKAPVWRGLESSRLSRPGF